MHVLNTVLLAGLAAWAAMPAGASDTGAVCLPYPVNARYVEECGSCHVAYAPSLLPARSWRKTMASLEQHFDSDASLAEPVRLDLEKHLVQHALDSEDATCRMDRMARSLPARTVPLRITETPYFKRIHSDLKPAVWRHDKVGSPANCGACHSRAEKGRYPARELRLPEEIRAYWDGARTGCCRP